VQTAVGLGFSVRNNGPVPLTMVAVKGLGSESPVTLAELDPVLSPAGGPGAAHSHLTAHVAFSRSTSHRVRTRPSSSSRMRSYDAVRGHWSPGVGMRFESARLTVRVLAMSSETEVPLQQALQINSPAAGACP
jgi:hypothetical protein